MFDLLLWDLQITLDEIFYDAVMVAKNKSKMNIDLIIDEYEKYRQIQRIYERMNELKYDEIDWRRGHEDGIFCLLNYFQISQLKDFKEEGIKNYLSGEGDLELKNKTVEDLKEKYEKSI